MRGACEVGGSVRRALDVDRLQRGDAAEGAQLVGLLLQRLPRARAQPDRQLEQRVERLVLAEQLLGGLLADAARAGQPSDGSPRSAMKSGTWSGRTP
jgi:hypothetical protein